EKRPLKPLISVFLGLLISSIGIDSVSGNQRLTFGIVQLWDGVNIAAVAVGLFGFSETLILLERKSADKVELNKKFKFSELFPKISEVIATLPAMLRGSVLGFIVGALPGTGSTIASFGAYDLEKKLSKNPDSFGKGAPAGLSTSEASNNGAVGGSLIPTFALGIPGSAPCAILLGGLMMMGLQPGPLLMQNSGHLVWAAFAGLFVANILLLIMNIFLVPFFTLLIQKVTPYIIPLIGTLCFVGVYFIGNNFFHVFFMFLFGILGLFMRKTGMPLPPLFLGVILGPMIEKNIRQALLISGGDYSIFFTEPISLFFIAVTAIVLILPLIKNIRHKIKSKATSLEKV
ncbi:MAG: tripartite tricarboxylate transporter permease, partial [Dehalobacterium sp.]